MLGWWKKASLGNWQTLEIAGHPVHYWNPVRRSGRDALLYLHDEDAAPWSSLPGSEEFLQALGWPVVCPQAGATWWLDRLVPTFDPHLSPQGWLLEHVLPWIQNTLEVAPRSVALLGKGMGGQGALQLGLTRGDLFPVVVSLQASIAFEQLYGRGTMLDHCFSSPEQCRQYTTGMLIQPGQEAASLEQRAHPCDPVWFRGNDRLHEKLRALGISHEARLEGDGTPTWWKEQLCFALEYIQKAMQAEHRRLL